MIGSFENSWSFALITVIPQMSNEIILRKMLRSFAKLQISSGRFIAIEGSTLVNINLNAGL